MNARSTLACAAGVCLGVVLFSGLAGDGGRLKAAAPAANEPGLLLHTPREAPGGVAPQDPDVEEQGAAPRSVAATPRLRSRVYDALNGGGARLGERVALLSSLPDPLPEAGLYVLDPAAVSPLREAVRDARPSARIAVAGFRPGLAGGDPEADAATLASVDALALPLPAGADAAAARRFCDEVGRHGRRVFALVPVPREPGELPAWRAGFAGATAAGVGVVLTGSPGGDPAVEAAWRADVAEHAALQRRLAGIAYD